MDSIDNYISDEMLAAYIDGNAIPVEVAIIEEYLHDDDLQELFDIVQDIKSNPECLEKGEYLKAEFPDDAINEVSLERLKKSVEGNTDLGSIM